jgi:hypothetical protein
MKYIITKEVEAQNIEEAIKKERRAKIQNIQVLPEESQVGYV